MEGLCSGQQRVYSVAHSQLFSICWEYLEDLSEPSTICQLGRQIVLAVGQETSLNSLFKVPGYDWLSEVYARYHTILVQPKGVGQRKRRTIRALNLRSGIAEEAKAGIGS